MNYQPKEVPQEASATLRQFLDNELADIAYVLNNPGTYTSPTENEFITGLWTHVGLNIVDAGGTDGAVISHNGTHFLTALINTNHWKITGYSGALQVQDLWVRGGDAFRIYDSTNTDYWNIRHNGTDILWTFVNTGVIQIVGTDLNFTAGAALRFYDADNSHWVTQDHDGADYNIVAAVESGITWEGFTSAYFLSGPDVRIYDATDTDYASFSHDGVDFITDFSGTADWNITNLAAINAGTVDADFDALTATSYGGIPEAELTSSDGTTGGSGSAGSGNDYVELVIGGTTYKMLHDGVV